MLANRQTHIRSCNTPLRYRERSNKIDLHRSINQSKLAYSATQRVASEFDALTLSERETDGNVFQDGCGEDLRCMRCGRILQKLSTALSSLSTLTRTLTLDPNGRTHSLPSSPTEFQYNFASHST